MFHSHVDVPSTSFPLSYDLYTHISCMVISKRNLSPSPSFYIQRKKGQEGNAPHGLSFDGINTVLSGYVLFFLFCSFFNEYVSFGK